LSGAILNVTKALGQGEIMRILTLLMLLQSISGVGCCFTWHVQVSLVFVSILKQEDSSIAGCMQCDIWGITAYFLLLKLKYYHKK
jgi:hypothetical protein